LIRAASRGPVIFPSIDGDPDDERAKSLIGLIFSRFFAPFAGKIS
jgi:hypothetical protein